ncbi:MAG: hypothetical protein RSD28_06895 [Lachnospiraceae bacterium]
MKELNGDLVTKITILVAFLVSGANLVYCIVKEKQLTNPILLFTVMVLWTGWYALRQYKKKQTDTNKKQS